MPIHYHKRIKYNIEESRGRIMHLWDVVRLRYDRTFYDFLKQLVDRKLLKNAALDITKMILAGDSHKLSIKQAQVFRDFVYYKYKNKRCKKCNKSIYWDEMADAICNGYLCGDCFWGYKE